MKNKLLALILVIVVVLAMTACGKNEHNVDYGMMDLETHYKALEELAYDSELIVEVELTGKTQDISYSNATFKVTETQVKKVMKGDPQLDSNIIRILELAAFNMGEHKRNVFFLEKYEGPVTSDAYVVAGVYQGRFKLDENNKVVYDADKYNGVKSFQANVEGLDARSFEAIVQDAIKHSRPPE